MGFGKAQPVTLVATLADDLAAYLTETPLARDQRIERVGERYVLRATVPNTWQQQWWILSLGEKCIVHEPTDLREKSPPRSAALP